MTDQPLNLKHAAAFFQRVVEIRHHIPTNELDLYFQVNRDWLMRAGSLPVEGNARNPLRVPINSEQLKLHVRARADMVKIKHFLSFVNGRFITPWDE